MLNDFYYIASQMYYRINMDLDLYKIVHVGLFFFYISLLAIFVITANLKHCTFFFCLKPSVGLSAQTTCVCVIAS